MTEDSRDDRIRARAHAIWEQEGRPEGREQAHWDMASELVAQEENYTGTLERNPSRGPDDVALHQQPVEPTLAYETMGEVPGLTDQGEDRQFPSRDAIPGARDGA
ncbi:DUF2934 domain-containing protein [Oleisolibacter albus]|uniref:DUF2934 domain-containing protein n=1 Tax=Oleisolibacter albus TaxID=2171757 RepID=UPI000DF26937|nr:DUF2934 domain-containing protein [Oleisolibacter albus]